MSATTGTAPGTLTFQIHIRATPEAIWDAITQPERAERYGYGGHIEVDLRPGGAYRALSTTEQQATGMPEVMVEGEIVEVDPGRRLVQTWHALFGPETTAEPSTRLTWELAPSDFHPDTVTRVTLTHDAREAPVVAAIVSGSMPGSGGGWPMVLSDMKTLLETGSSFNS